MPIEDTVYDLNLLREPLSRLSDQSNDLTMAFERVGQSSTNVSKVTNRFFPRKENTPQPKDTNYNELQTTQNTFLQSRALEEDIEPPTVSLSDKTYSRLDSLLSKYLGKTTLQATGNTTNSMYNSMASSISTGQPENSELVALKQSNLNLLETISKSTFTVDNNQNLTSTNTTNNNMTSSGDGRRKIVQEVLPVKITNLKELSMLLTKQLSAALSTGKSDTVITGGGGSSEGGGGGLLDLLGWGAAGGMLGGDKNKNKDSKNKNNKTTKNNKNTNSSKNKVRKPPRAKGKLGLLTGIASGLGLGWLVSGGGSDDPDYSDNDSESSLSQGTATALSAGQVGGTMAEDAIKRKVTSPKPPKPAAPKPKTSFFGSLWSSAKETYNSAKEGIKTTGNWVSDKYQSVREAAEARKAAKATTKPAPKPKPTPKKGFWASAWDKTKSAAKSVKDGVTNKASAAGKWVSEKASSAKQAIKAAPGAIGNFIDNKTTAIKESAKNLASKAAKGYNYVASGGLKDDVVKKAKSVGKKAITGIKTAGKYIKDPKMALEAAKKAIKSGSKKALRALFKVPIIGSAIEAIFASYDIKDILGNKEMSPEDKKKETGRVVMKSVAGVAGGAAVAALLTTTGVGALASGVGYILGDAAGRWAVDLFSDDDSLKTVGDITGGMFGLDFGEAETAELEPSEDSTNTSLAATGTDIPDNVSTNITGSSEDSSEASPDMEGLSGSPSASPLSSTTDTTSNATATTSNATATTSNTNDTTSNTATSTQNIEDLRNQLIMARADTKKAYTKMINYGEGSEFQTGDEYTSLKNEYNQAADKEDKILQQIPDEKLKLAQQDLEAAQQDLDNHLLQVSAMEETGLPMDVINEETSKKESVVSVAKDQYDQSVKEFELATGTPASTMTNNTSIANNDSVSSSVSSTDTNLTTGVSRYPEGSPDDKKKTPRQLSWNEASLIKKDGDLSTVMQLGGTALQKLGNENTINNIGKGIVGAKNMFNKSKSFITGDKYEAIDPNIDPASQVPGFVKTGLSSVSGMGDKILEKENKWTTLNVNGEIQETLPEVAKSTIAAEPKQPDPVQPQPINENKEPNTVTNNSTNNSISNSSSTKIINNFDTNAIAAERVKMVERITGPGNYG